MLAPPAKAVEGVTSYATLKAAGANLFAYGGDGPGVGVPAGGEVLDGVLEVRGGTAPGGGAGGFDGVDGLGERGVGGLAGSRGDVHADGVPEKGGGGGEADVAGAVHGEVPGLGRRTFTTVCKKNRRDRSSKTGQLFTIHK